MASATPRITQRDWDEAKRALALLGKLSTQPIYDDDIESIPINTWFDALADFGFAWRKNPVLRAFGVAAGWPED